jgi:dihydroflavonol-4-reductase
MGTLALITGANGHIGSNLVRELLDHDYDVRAMVRTTSDTRGIDDLDIELRHGDIVDSTAVHEAVDGVDVVFHLAAPYRTWARDVQEIIRPAVEGTRNVLEAASDSGVDLVVATSSCNAVGFADDENEPRNEQHWNESTRAPYFRAKAEAERLGFEWAEELGVDFLTVLPTGVLGRYDYRGTPTTQPVVAAMNGKGPVPFAMNAIDVRDVATGHRLAAEKGKPGERYLLGGDNHSADEVADVIEGLTGARPSVGLPPVFLLKIVATITETFGRFTGNPPPISRAEIRDAAGKSPVFDCTKARTELGLAPAPMPAVMQETFDWAAEMGWLSPKVRGRQNGN